MKEPIGKHCIVRTFSAGVFAGVIEEKNGKEARLSNARRLWFWAGASSLSQLAVDGTKTPQRCKFPCPVPEVYLTEVIEVIPTTEVARKSIDEVPVWQQ